MNRNSQSFVSNLNHNKMFRKREKMMNGSRFVLLSLTASLLLGSCALFAKPEPSDFDARDGDFAGYEKWALAGTTTGESDQLDMAHDAKNPAVTRYIFVKDDAVNILSARSLPNNHAWRTERWWVCQPRWSNAPKVSAPTRAIGNGSCSSLKLERF
jgi:hypothetical protein